MPVPFKNNYGQVMYNIQCTNANNILYQPPQSHRMERKLKQSCNHIFHWRINIGKYILFFYFLFYFFSVRLLSECKNIKDTYILKQ